MHDIGKIGIPDDILKKPAKLTVEEFDIIKRHSIIGAEIIGHTDNELIHIAKIIALEHHEKWNGKGYPKGLKGEEINLYARITSVADVFDALLSRRPYKEPWMPNDTIEWIKEQSGKDFDPKVVEAFIRALPELLKIEKIFRD